MIPALDSTTSALPLGRHVCELGEIEARFVTGASERRATIWHHWLDITEVLRSHLCVRYAWVSGSFFTTIAEPDDLDCVYWAEDVDIDAALARPESAQVVAAVQTLGELKRRGIPLDTFLLPWRSNPESYPRDLQDVEYYQNRGYWDDLWVRIRAGAKGAQKVRLDSIPRRGYLEVNLDGFPER